MTIYGNGMLAKSTVSFATVFGGNIGGCHNPYDGIREKTDAIKLAQELSRQAHCPTIVVEYNGFFYYGETNNRTWHWPLLEAVVWRSS